jgi:hypothetical protein
MIISQRIPLSYGEILRLHQAFGFDLEIQCSVMGACWRGGFEVVIGGGPCVAIMMLSSF